MDHNQDKLIDTLEISEEEKNELYRKAKEAVRELFLDSLMDSFLKEDEGKKEGEEETLMQVGYTKFDLMKAVVKKVIDSDSYERLPDTDKRVLCVVMYEQTYNLMNSLQVHTGNQ